MINRLPSWVVNNDTPFFRLFGQQPDYISLHTFSCACWLNLRPYIDRKLEFRSKQCVFLGYSNQYKRFKCLDPKAGCIYISRDVIFDEQVFPFASLHPNASAQLRDELALLPDILMNPSCSSGGAQISDQRLFSLVPTNTSQLPGESVFDAAQELVGNPGKNGETLVSKGQYFMCPLATTTRVVRLMHPMDL